MFPAAIDLGITIVGRRADRIRLRSDAAEEPVDIAADGSADDPPSGWARYVAAVEQELGALGRAPIGFEGRVTSTLPAGAGLASSAALEVAIAVALCAVAELELPPLELAAACRRAEERAVGVPCGIMDQAASVLGEEGCAILLDCGSLEHRAVRLPAGVALVAVDSGVRHAHEHSGYG
ncbi:MAG: galactokinase, partial [Gaiellaceae bacterium]|nr:galactokinase [Gaiellaceae bacterium]